MICYVVSRNNNAVDLSGIITFDHILDIDINDKEWNVMDLPNDLKNKYSNVIGF